MTAAFVGVTPHGAVWKYFKECREQTPDGFLVCLEKLNVHGHNTVGIQVLFHHFKELLCVEIRGALDPWIEWIGGDCVEAVIRCEEVMAPVVDVHLDPGITQDIEIVLSEISRSRLRN